MKGALTKTDAPQARHRDKVESIRREKREAVERQRAIRAREKAEMEDRLARQKERARSREEKIIASQRAEIESLKAQAKALKALGALARRTQRAPRATEKSERFGLIFQLREEDPSFNVSAACGALEVSRRGYYDWVAARPGRLEREKADLAAKEQVEAAFASHGSRKGSRQIVDCLARGQKVRMSRRKVQRIMRKFGIVWEGKRRRPCGPIGQDGEPKVAPNAVDRDFRRGAPLKAVSADITCLPCMDEGFVCMSGILDCQTDVLLAQKCSISMEERLVLDTYDQLRGLVLPDGIRTGPGSPGSGSPCPGGPAAGTMHASGASGDGWRSRWETRHISLRGGHGACRQARRLLQRSQGAGASRMADPHGACRKVHCLAVCGDWGPPQRDIGNALEKLQHGNLFLRILAAAFSALLMLSPAPDRNKDIPKR